MLSDAALHILQQLGIPFGQLTASDPSASTDDKQVFIAVVHQLTQEVLNGYCAHGYHAMALTMCTDCTKQQRLASKSTRLGL